MKELIKNFFNVLIIFLLVSFLFGLFSRNLEKREFLSLSQLVSAINEGKVSKIFISGENILVIFKDGKKAISQKEPESSLSQTLLNLGVDKERLKEVEIETKREGLSLGWIWPLIYLLSPILFFFIFFWFLSKQAKTGAGQIFDFTRARARLYGAGGPPKERVTFKDVAGLKEAKEELKEIVDFLKNPRKYLEMGAKIPRGVLLVGPPGCGKCVVGSTFILTNKGWIKIQDVPKYFSVNEKREVEGVELFSVDLRNFEVQKVKPSHWYELGKEKTIKIITQLGLELEGTFEHPVVIWNEKGEMEFKRLKEIKKGDLIVINYNQQVFGNYKILPDKETAYFLGILVGDGGLSIKNRIFFSNKNKEIVEFVKRYLKTHFNVRLQKSKSRKYDYYLTNWKVKEKIREWGISESLARGKEIPESILFGPKEYQVEFLRGLFDTDGSVSEKYSVIQLGSASKTLIQKVQLLLLNLGVISRVRKKLANQYGEFYHYLEISGDFCEKFAKEINFKIEEKKKKLEKILEKKRNSNTNIVYHAGEKLFKLWMLYKLEKGKIPQQIYRTTFYKLLSAYKKQEKHPTKFSVDKYLEFFKRELPSLTKTLEFKQLEKLANNSFFFTRVITKEYGEGVVYDFTVPKIHSFIANGMINHNTLLAKAVAGESNVPFFYTSGSSFTELFVGVGASRVRSLFDQAKKAGRAIIFIDEIDAIGKVRGFGISGGQEEREQTLNEILNQMDGFEKESGVIVMAASVTGDTPVLIKRNGKYELLPISEVIDPYYKEGEEGVEKEVKNLEVLGLEKKEVKKFGSKKNIYFGKAAFKKVKSVFRHKVNEIYEIEYLGGKIKATANHSVFVRTKWGLKTKPVSELKTGDILVDIPFVANRANKKEREVRAFSFKKEFNVELPVWQPTFEKFKPLNFIYQTVLSLAGKISQTKLAWLFGYSQSTIGNWQRGIYFPRGISKNYYQHKEILPEKVRVTPELMRLFGYYVAEGYVQKGVDFCFNKKEKEKIEDLKKLMKKIFNLEPSQEYFITPGAITIRYFSTPVGNFFAYHCGKGAKNKHVPQVLFEAPFEYFKEFLRGYLGGDGYIDKRKRGEITSVSKRLILELNWLFRMHGFKSYVYSFKAKEGRRIKSGKPLKETIAWRIGFGKTQNPLNKEIGKENIKRPIVKAVRKLPYNGYVYDFCGCENEAFFGGENPILLHNTNKPELLDPALLRPGRFDRRIVLDLPDVNEREEILKIHCRGKPLALNVNLREIAERTPGFSGADLANLVNEAAILAARKGKKQIFQEEFLESIDKVLLGPERRSHLLSKKEKEIAAYHEAGHAIVSAFLKEAEPVRKISIIPRGLAAGYTLKTPTEERRIKTKSEFLAEMAVLLGGYCAEKIKFGEITTGAANDLEKATQLAKKLVMEYGMSDLGPIAFGKKEELVFLGREEIYRDFSEKVAEKIDREVEKFVKNAENKAREILMKKKRLLEKVAQRLIEKETIEREEFEELIGKKKVIKIQFKKV